MIKKMERYQPLKNGVISAITSPSSKSIEVIIALFCFMLGAWVVNPLHSGFFPPENYKILLGLMTEEAWGIFFLLISFAQLYFIYMSRDEECFCAHRKATLTIQFCVWAMIAISFLITTQSTAVPIYTTMSILTAYAMVRVGYNE